jgi:hypothetical protein
MFTCLLLTRIYVISYGYKFLAQAFPPQTILVNTNSLVQINFLENL